MRCSPFNSLSIEAKDTTMLALEKISRILNLIFIWLASLCLAAMCQYRFAAGLDTGQGHL